MSDDPLRVISRLKNNRLVEERERRFMNAKQFAAFLGVGYQSYVQWECLRGLPSKANQRLLADALGKSPDWLFPPYLKGVRKTLSIKTVPEKEVLRITDVDPALLLMDGEQESLVLNRELRDVVAKVLHKLRRREREVVMAMFGLDDGREKTLEEAGEKFGVSREHIRQIEANALRHLRHPRLSRYLQDFRHGREI